MERPILFSTEMVKAILEDRKTQTRRTRGLELFNSQPNRWRREGNEMAFDGGFEYKPLPTCPYGQPGDILWVRETGWKYNGNYYFAADYLYGTKQLGKEAKIFPSIHMPREAARLFLRAKKVRVERLQDIDVASCVREGVDFGNAWTVNAKPAFIKLWDSINAKRGYGWDMNPWVWVIEFERVS